MTTDLHAYFRDMKRDPLRDAAGEAAFDTFWAGVMANATWFKGLFLRMIREPDLRMYRLCFRVGYRLGLDQIQEESQEALSVNLSLRLQSVIGSFQGSGRLSSGVQAQLAWCTVDDLYRQLRAAQDRIRWMEERQRPLWRLEDAAERVHGWIDSRAPKEVVVEWGETLESLRRSRKSEPFERTTTPEGASMKPSIGRIVHYQRYGSPGGEHKPEPSPAVITQVLGDDECVLFVMNPNGLYFNRTPFSAEPKPGHWSWPPKV